MKLSRIIFLILRYSGIPYLLRKTVQSNVVTILLFHDIKPDIANKTLLFLKKNYNIISLKNFIKYLNKEILSIPNNSLIITFDDGHIGNYKLKEIFIKNDLPVTIFLCAGLINTFRHYWFKYENIKSKSELKKLNNNERLFFLEAIGFNQQKDFDYPQALTMNQINEMKNLVDFQSHTLFHPILPMCNNEESYFEIVESKNKLEKEFKLDIYAIAFPNGDYTEREIEYCKSAGYKCAITVDYGFNTKNTDPFKLKRLSVNDTEDLNELIVKSSGLWGWVKIIFKQFRLIK